MDADKVPEGTKKVMIPVVPATEGCRTPDDVMGVLLEKHLTGVFIPVRRAGDVVERVEKTIIANVTPKSDPVFEEVSIDEVTEYEQSTKEK